MPTLAEQALGMVIDNRERIEPPGIQHPFLDLLENLSGRVIRKLGARFGKHFLLTKEELVAVAGGKGAQASNPRAHEHAGPVFIHGGNGIGVSLLVQLGILKSRRIQGLKTAGDGDQSRGIQLLFFDAADSIAGIIHGR